MKFAHFPCQQMPKALQDRFTELKDDSLQSSKLSKDGNSKRAGGANASTAQYYHDSACEIGMVDRNGGIFARNCLSAGSDNSSPSAGSDSPVAPQRQPDPSYAIAAISQATALNGILLGNLLPTLAYANAAAVASQPQVDPTQLMNSSVAEGKPLPSLAIAPMMHTNLVKTTQAQRHQGNKRLLSSESDSQYLAPIHCFVRRHVEVFAANEQDLATPAPGRKKPIALGQVGLRCIHCARLPVKDRVKRAVCFPPSVSGCYHAVSNSKSILGSKQCKMRLSAHI